MPESRPVPTAAVPCLFQAPATRPASQHSFGPTAPRGMHGKLYTDRLRRSSEGQDASGSIRRENPNPDSPRQKCNIMLSVQLLGDLKVQIDGERIPLPCSRKTRALLGYLLLSDMPQRRDHLCGLLWDIPDDPRGALRWSLSKLRPVVNAGGIVRLISNGERVRIDFDDVAIDVHDIRRCAADESATCAELASAWHRAGQPLMEDCELPNQEIFFAWLRKQKDDIVRLRIRLARRLTLSDDIPPDEALLWADRWLDDAPFDREAAEKAVAIRRLLGREREASFLANELGRAFADAHLQPPSWERQPRPTAGRKQPVQRNRDASPKPKQKIRFANAPDGTRLSWAAIGADDAPPFVMTANWLSHLGLDWETPIWNPLFRELTREHCLIRYDERGCGLSDWDVPEISFESFVTDLELIVETAGITRFPLMGISQGAAVAIEYASRYPENVSHLILFGGYAEGWRYTASAEEAREQEAVTVLVEAGWGQTTPSHRHMFSQTFIPDATPQELEWFDEYQRRTTSAKNAGKFLKAFSEINVRERLASLEVPTLILHSRGDKRIPVTTAWDLAAAIPNAQFVGLDSQNHFLLGREPAAETFLCVLREFLQS